MSWDIEYSEKSIQDILDIYEYIAFELSEPVTAERMIGRIRAAIRSLDEMPARHPVYDAEPMRSMAIRAFAVEKYLVLYLANDAEHRVTVVRVIFGGRDLSERDIE